jgi:hypothetical protein
MKRAALVAAALLGLGAAGDKIAPGSYCPLPEGDEPPACLQDATESYGGFFAGLEQGQVPPDALARVEDDLAGDERYRALSSLSYAYYVLSLRAAESEQVDAQTAERLEHWNQLLGTAYVTSDDVAFRSALREAAGDLQERAPGVQVRCSDAEGNRTECTSTEVMLASMTDTRDRTGLRGLVGRLLESIFGGGG